MKGNHSAALRALYIILVPVVLLIILLNSGWLQRLLPAATVHGETYSVVRYNFYYFDYYNSFLEQYEDQLDELGYDPEQADSDQIRDDGLSWKEFIRREAEANLAETAYYCDLAQAAGYTFSEEELAPVAEQLAKNEAQRAQYGISSNNYYISYYGAGMNEERYVQELTRKVQAQAYKAHLEAAYTPAPAEVAQWRAEHPETDYQAVHLRVITLEALPDRATGEIGSAQLDALSAKLERLVARYESGVDFAQLQAAFSSRALGDDAGVLRDATTDDLPAGLASWCLANQGTLTAGDTYSYVDSQTGTAYFAVLDGLGDSGPELDAEAALSAQAIETAQQTALETDYAVSRNPLGMQLATT